eukprot:Skav208358  [mRNA]  locus=scaffold1964:326268:336696:+ [translate_table: standard]
MLLHRNPGDRRLLSHRIEPGTVPPNMGKQGKSKSNKGDGKGQKGQGKQGQPGRNLDMPPEPPWPAPPALKDAGKQASTPAQPMLSAADPEMTRLLAMLRKDEVASTLPREAQDIVNNVMVQTSRQATKEMHAAVAAVAKAKTHLQSCRDARINLHISWKEHIAQSIQRWQEYSKSFRTRDSELEQEIEQAVTAMKAARVTMETAQKAVASATLVEDGGEISDEDLGDPSTSQVIQTNLDQLENSLKAINWRTSRSIFSRNEAEEKTSCQCIRRRATRAYGNSLIAKCITGTIWCTSLAGWTCSDGGTIFSGSGQIDRKEVCLAHVLNQYPELGCELPVNSLQWCHSVCHDEGFVSPWLACEAAHWSAFDLLLESQANQNGLDAVGCVLTVQCLPLELTSCLRAPSSPSSSKCVRFHDSVQIGFCSHALPAWPICVTSVPMDGLDNWYAKPWSLHESHDPVAWDAAFPMSQVLDFSTESTLTEFDVATFMQQPYGSHLRDASRSRDRSPMSSHGLTQSMRLSEVPSVPSTAQASSPQHTRMWAIFRLGTDRVDCALPVIMDRPTFPLLAMCLECEPEEIEVALPVVWQIYQLPPDISPVIVLLQGERPTDENLCVILIDVVVHRRRQDPSVGRSPKLHREVRFVPLQLDRHGFLQQIGLSAVCRTVGSCIVHCNHVLWAESDTAFHLMTPASYCLVHVAPSPDDDHAADLVTWLQDVELSVCSSLPVSTDASPIVASSDVDSQAELGDLIGRPLSDLESEVSSQYIVHTWLVCHRSRPFSAEFRMVRLPRDPHQWRQILQRIWDDHLDGDTPYGLRLVSPQPSVLTGDDMVALPHLIIELSARPDEVALLVAVQSADSQELSPPFRFVASFLRTSDLAVLRRLVCRFTSDVDLNGLYPGMRAWVDGVAWTSVSTPPLITGQSAEVRMVSNRRPDSESTSLVQISSPLPTVGSGLASTIAYFQAHLSGLQPSDALIAHAPGISNNEDANESGRTAVMSHQHFSSASSSNLSSDESVDGSMDQLQRWWITEGADRHDRFAGPRFLTYYLDGSRRVTCDHPREVQVGQVLDPFIWLDLFQRVWHDEVDLTRPLFFYLVMPQPPRDRDGISRIHLILLQNPIPAFCPFMLAVRPLRDDWKYRAIHGASSTNRYALILLSDWAPLCFRTTVAVDCIVKWHGRVMSDRDVHMVRPGMCFTMQITDAAIPVQPSWTALPGPGLTGDSVQVLQDICTTLRNLQPTDTPIFSWFLHHRDFPVCHQSRVLLLPASIDLWSVEVCRLWHDFCDPQSEIRARVVHPQPTQYDAAHSAVHVVFDQQGPGDTPRVSALYEVHIAWRTLFFAKSTPQTVDRTLLLHLAEVDDLCLGAGATHRCECWHGPSRFQSDVALRPSAGSLFSIEVSQWTEDTPAASAVSLVQLRTQVFRAPPFQSRCDGGAIPLYLDPLVSAPFSEDEWMSIDVSQVLLLQNQLDLCVLPPPLPVASLVKWHASTLAALEQIPASIGVPPPHLLAVDFYTDGSSCFDVDRQGRVGASAVVLVWTTSLGQVFGGFRPVLVDFPATAQRAEHYAITVALLWLLELRQVLSAQVGTPSIGVHFDCYAAGFTAAGCWSSPSHPDLNQLNRGLTQYVEQNLLTTIQWSHVPAHTGHAWNEAADAASWAALAGWIDCPLISSLLDTLFLSDLLTSYVPWLWYLKAIQQGHPGFPVLHGRSLRVSLGKPLRDSPKVACVPLSVPQVPSPVIDHVPFVLKCASANVLTLYPTKKATGEYTPGRQLVLMQQFHTAGVHAIGIQESRATWTGHRELDSYHVFSAAAAHGNYGVQLWLMRTLDTPHGAFVLRHSHCRIVHASSRRLIVVVQAPWLKLRFVVGHAPSGHDAVTQQFWDITSHLLQSHKSIPVIALLDANSRLGSRTSAAVGDHASWLLQKPKQVPSSISPESRLDYVAISQHLFHDQTCCFDSVVDLTLAREDHRCVELHLPISLARFPKRARPPLRAFSSLDLRAQVAAVPWSCNVHDHAHLVHEWVASHAPVKPVKQLRKRHLSDSTWQLIQQKQFHWLRFKGASRESRRAMLVEFFFVWSSVARSLKRMGLCVEDDVTAFDTPQGLQTHCLRAHDAVSYERRLSFGVVCQACHKCFWTSQRLQQHLRQSRLQGAGCFYILAESFAPDVDPHTSTLPDHLKGVERVPAVMSLGPHPPLPAARFFPPAWFDLEWRHDWLSADLPEFMLKSDYQWIEGTLNTVTLDLAPSSCPDPVTAWLECLHSDTGPVSVSDPVLLWGFALWGRRYLLGSWSPPWSSDWTACLLPRFLDFMADLDVWQLLCRADVIPGALLDTPPHSSDSVAVDAVACQHRPLEDFTGRYATTQDWIFPFADLCGSSSASCMPVAVVWNGCGRPALVIVHCFSGRRRHADMHDWLMKAGADLFPDFVIFPLSVDTAVCHVSGDLLSTFVLQAIEELCGLSAVALCLTGPRCETWSAARFLDLSNDDVPSRSKRAPRPLRSLQSPWGIADLCLRELAQVDLSNQLLWTGLYIETMVLLSGGGAVMEHPAPSPNPDHPSVWRTAAHKDLFDHLHGAVHHQLEQLRYGARCRKPTTLRAVGLPHFGDHLEAWANPCEVHPTVTLGGRNRDGSFKTAIAKEYPPSFSRAIAASALASLRVRMSQHGCRLVDADRLSARSKVWFESIVEAGSQCTRTTFLPDYQPNVVGKG